MTRLVDPYWFPEQFDLVHDLARILGVFLGQELAESESLMCLRDPVFGEVDVTYGMSWRR